MIDGAARGGGAEFLTALDLRYASPRAVLGQPEVPMGILPGAGGTARLPRLLGRSRALEIILTGRDIPAEEACAIGWVDAVVPSEDLSAYADAIAQRIASMPPESIAAVKRVVDTSLGSITPALTAETDALGQLIAGGGHRVPMERFLAAVARTAYRRPPACPSCSTPCGCPDRRTRGRRRRGCQPRTRRSGPARPSPAGSRCPLDGGSA